ncbi:uncharacterized protein BCR38DRAFT_355692 [Pseudomassariella vexata]|uniref:Actin cytoskeleton-regulatory complex protein SLA1 n=1 Tax=Pseudomassariella vexata TaxID=1141098 RepID=A0A1Y2DBN0_9PEZI|nr:uncharacterized protein BCR38DRAFT_355692 [Pseudomassariella vexata]ORY56670.1 hypothetical protein BCR38DRAFT_355692 [Pseudomassariella vexata]
MGFLGVYRAIFDYAPASEGELAINEGDLLYVLEKSQDDDWWKAKKKATADDDDEPTGLIPNNYIEEAAPVNQARALYEYTRQTDEELSFPEDAKLQVFDVSDPDWILVGLDGEYGFVPANYIDMGDAVDEEPEPEPEPEPQPQAPPLPPALPSRPPATVEPEEEPLSPPLPTRQPSTASETSSPAVATPASALANVMQGRTSSRAPAPPPVAVPAPRQEYLSEEDDEPSPALPTRPRAPTSFSEHEQTAPTSPARTQSARRSDQHHDYTSGYDTGQIAPGGFHLYNINEMVSVMGKKKKMPTTLGVNLKTGKIFIAPERTSDGPSTEWTGDKMTHYSREGKHVFLELVRPSRSIDFHAGAQDTAEEIVSALGELAGAVRAEGLREVMMAATGRNSQKKGIILYDFMAQGEDEVTVAVGDEVLIVDDAKSEEWWQVRRLKTGKEGVVPSSYIEVTEVLSPPANSSGVNAGRSTVAQNRLEEERLTKEAIKRDQKVAEVGPGLRLPVRSSSLSAGTSDNNSLQQRSKRENGRAEGSGSRSSSDKAKPDRSKVRTWTDRSKSFTVEAQFLGIKDGKINLHKMNGVKIAVPITKMSAKDLEYVELMTGISLDEDKPLSDVKRANTTKVNATRDASSKVGASIEQPKSDYDWFQFFLSCDVAVGLCERYAQSFAKDSMDESVLPDVDASVLRNLGLREGDIIKVMRFLDKKYGRDGKKKGVSFAGDEDGEGSGGGLFSGPGGTLRNNTRKGRPAPAVQTNDTIDAKAFSNKNDSSQDQSATPSPSAGRSEAAKPTSGFDDDAWDVKPSKQPKPQTNPAPTPEPKAATPPPSQPPPTQGMLDLSLLSQPLEPIKAQPTVSAPQIIQAPPQPAPQIQPQSTAAQQPGATPAFFTGLAQQQTGLQQQPTGAQPLNLGLGGNRQRPVAPQMTQGQGGLVPPPPARPLSAPQSAQPSGFAPPPLQPQMTGIAPPGQSLNDLNQQRMQQQYMGSFQPQPTGQGMMGYNPTGIQPQPTGFGGPNQFQMPPQVTGAPQMQSPFADPRASQFSSIQVQPTGFHGGFNAGQQFPQPTGVNSFLPPALEPQRTGMPPMQQSMQPQPTGFGGGFGIGFNPGINNQQAPQPPPPAPLQPQQTGPAPPVRFGVADKIAPQATGRRANLAHATPQNPFGF